MNIITWNTGRHYTEHGQRIAAYYDPYDKIMYFVDMDRGIDGMFETEQDLFSVKEEVMLEYDNGHYKHFPRHTDKGWDLYQQLTEAALNHKGGYK